MTKRTKDTFHLISLGCAKNLVDSESMAHLLNRHGLLSAPNPDEAEFLIVNTCGFINAAREEAIAVLTDLASEKLPWQKLIVAGCMTELHREDILQSVPGIDGLLGTRRWMDIMEVVKKSKAKQTAEPYAHFPLSTSIEQDKFGTIRAAPQGSSAYLKIADGCRRTCAYCLIPLIKGSHVSRPIKDIIEDAKALQDQGIKEIILISQDTTDYGHDLDLKNGLQSLLENLIIAIPHIPWIRLMYTYPGYVRESLINLMASEPQILPYLDLPLQHADPKILKSMRRPSNMDEVRKTLTEVQSSIPDIALRTTFIIGYPGEDEKSFQRLIDFVQDIRFDHVGAFPYSFEPGSPAETLGDPISEHTKTARLEYLMQVQAQISLARNQTFIGKKMQVLVEGVDEDSQISIGRSYRDAPEIDGLVMIEGLAPLGDMVQVQINSAITHDLVGTLSTE